MLREKTFQETDMSLHLRDARMADTVDKFQILKTIVVLAAIFVMNVLPSSQDSAHALCHYQPMFKEISGTFTTSRIEAVDHGNERIVWMDIDADVAITCPKATAFPVSSRTLCASSIVAACHTEAARATLATLDCGNSPDASPLNPTDFSTVLAFYLDNVLSGFSVRLDGVPVNSTVGAILDFEFAFQHLRNAAVHTDIAVLVVTRLACSSKGVAFKSVDQVRNRQPADLVAGFANNFGRKIPGARLVRRYANAHHLPVNGASWQLLYGRTSCQDSFLELTTLAVVVEPLAVPHDSAAVQTTVLDRMSGSHELASCNEVRDWLGPTPLRQSGAGPICFTDKA